MMDGVFCQEPCHPIMKKTDGGGRGLDSAGVDLHRCCCLLKWPPLPCGTKTATLHKVGTCVDLNPWFLELSLFRDEDKLLKGRRPPSPSCAQ
ncbi:hypothetical protein OPV22_011462 [Ensete ventricosum]|uniref:Uncharacterized protein n=1 Tax=Ensete ventricosum TaxID=4639 RepID=A0AAV8RFR4_ENSVE|nr:hypothetical protein OPV22_011462 [Ensete ventricosum]